MAAETTRELDGADAAAPRTGIPGWLLLLGVVVLTPLVALVLAVAVFAWKWRQDHVAAVAAVQAEVARIQASGEPVTTEDLYAFHRAPSGTPDTTIAWLAALNSLPEQAFNQRAQNLQLPIFSETEAALLRADVPGSKLADAETFLKEYDQTLQLTLDAAKLPGECRYPVQFEKGIGALLPNAQKLRSLTRLLALNVRVQIERGNTDAALESVDAMYAASDTLAHQLTLVEQLVRLATLGVAIEYTEQLLNEVELTDEQLARLQQRLQAQDVQAGLTQGLLGERGMGYHAFHHLGMLADSQEVDGLSMVAGQDGTLSRPADLQKYLELLGEVIDASEEPFPAAQQQVQRVDAKVKAIMGGGSPFERLKYMVTALLTPAVSAAFDATGRQLAERDAMLAAIAAKRYRLRNGEYPMQLTDLVPEFLPAVPNDPFDGMQLRMKTTPETIVIYSIGKDLKDDGGLDPDNRREPDIIVTLRAK